MDRGPTRVGAAADDRIGGRHRPWEQGRQPVTRSAAGTAHGAGAASSVRIDGRQCDGHQRGGSSSTGHRRLWQLLTGSRGDETGAGRHAQNQATLIWGALQRATHRFWGDDQRQSRMCERGTRGRRAGSGNGWCSGWGREGREETLALIPC
jgi:hypothetical protein